MTTVSNGFINTKINNISINAYACNSNNYNATNIYRDVKYIVIHYTGNTKDTALNNCKYFQSGSRSASSHFFVDDSNIYQSVKLKDVAWHCGCASGYKIACRNENSIGIEMCTSGNYLVSDTTQINAAYLCAHICKIIGIKSNSVDTYVVRHYDVVKTNKKCPAQFVNDEAQWTRFRTWVKNILDTGNYNSTSTPNNSNNISINTNNVDVTYAVKISDGRILPEVKNLTDYAGIEKKEITGIALKVNKGSVKYQVHIKGGNWLPWVTGYNWNDHKNGYAGNNKPIDAIRVYYITPLDIVSVKGYKKAKYRVSTVSNSSYYSWQLDDNISNGMDGYAGSFGKSIDKIQICIE